MCVCVRAYVRACARVRACVRVKEGRKEGTCLFDINNHNTEYTSVKILSGDSH